MEECFDSFGRYLRPQDLTLRLGAWRLQPDDPPAPPGSWARFTAPPGDWMPITTWLNGHPIGSRLFTPGTGDGLLWSDLVRESFPLCLWANLCAGAASGYLRVDVCLASRSPSQLRSLVELHRRLEEGLPLEYEQDGGVSLRLARHWVPASPSILAPVEAGDTARVQEVGRFCDRAFRDILFDRALIAAEELESIPGIHREAKGLAPHRVRAAASTRTPFPLLPAVRNPLTGLVMVGPTHATILNRAWELRVPIGEDARAERGFWDTELEAFMDRTVGMARAEALGLVRSRHTTLRAEWLPYHREVTLRVVRKNG